MSCAVIGPLTETMAVPSLIETERVFFKGVSFEKEKASILEARLFKASGSIAQCWRLRKTALNIRVRVTEAYRPWLVKLQEQDGTDLSSSN